MTYNFTIDDIHAIRNENYELIKTLSHEEIIAKTRREASKGWARLEQLKAAKADK